MTSVCKREHLTSQGLLTSPNPGYFMMTSPTDIALGLRAPMYGFGEGTQQRSLKIESKQTRPIK